MSSIIGGVEDIFGARNKFEARAPVNRFHADQAKLEQAQYGGAIQQGITGGAEAAGRQNALADMLAEQARGGGPNPALEQLRQTTAQNVNQAAGAAASARGINPALAARLAVDAAGGANQTAAGQAATMRAEQTLAAQGLLGQVVGQKRAQDIGTLGTAGGLQQGQNAVNLQNVLGTNQLNAGVAAQNAGLELGAQQINAGVAAQNAQVGAGLFGGALNSAGGAAGLFGAGTRPFAGGGEVPRLAEGDVVPDPMASLHDYLASLSGPVAPTQAPAGPKKPSAPAEPERPGPFANLGANSMAAFDRFQRHVFGSPLYATGGSIFRADGGVPGRAEVAGDSYRNDKVDAKLSPGEFVVKRSAVEQPGVKQLLSTINDHPEAAHDFVAHLVRRQGGGYERVLRARGMAEGGEAEPPSIADRFVAWLKSPPEKKVEAGRGVADAMNAALPETLSARSAVKKHEARLKQLDKDTQDMSEGGEVRGRTGRGVAGERHRSRIQKTDKPRREES